MVRRININIDVTVARSVKSPRNLVQDINEEKYEAVIQE